MCRNLPAVCTLFTTHLKPTLQSATPLLLPEALQNTVNCLGCITHSGTPWALTVLLSVQVSYGADGKKFATQFRLLAQQIATPTEEEKAYARACIDEVVKAVQGACRYAICVSGCCCV